MHFCKLLLKSKFLDSELLHCCRQNSLPVLALQKEFVNTELLNEETQIWAKNEIFLNC